jgi:hypothetical protein
VTDQPNVVTVQEITPGIFAVVRDGEVLRGGFKDRRVAFMWASRKRLLNPKPRPQRPPPQLPPELESERLLDVKTLAALNSECLQTVRRRLQRGEFGPPIKNGKGLYTTLRNWRRWKLQREVATA